MKLLLKDNQLLAQQIENRLMKSGECTVRFSGRELTCLYYLIRGMTYKQIAQTLELSPRTVETHIANIRKKWNCRTRSEIITKFLKLGGKLENLMTNITETIGD